VAKFTCTCSFPSIHAAPTCILIAD
jgi:hypothetical protein